MAIVVMFVGSLYPAGVLTMDKSQRRLEASLLAQSLLEHHRMIPFEQLAPGPVQALPPEEGTGLFHPTVQVLPVPSQGDGILEVRVSVTWRDHNRPQRTEVSVYVSEFSP